MPKICYPIDLKMQPVQAQSLLERPTLASRVPLFLLGHFPTNECENFRLLLITRERLGLAT